MHRSSGRQTRLFDRIESLDLIGVSRWYEGTCAVRDLTLSVRGGELIALIGGSGSGKTTTLRMINRLTEPDSGEVRINQIRVSTLDPVALRRSIGYVIQQIGLFPHLSVAENIAIPLEMAGYSRNEIAVRIDHLLTLVSLTPDQYRDRRPSELSGGQQQRVGLARALASDPPLLLMDEPFGALDPLLRRQLRQEFLRIRQTLDKTILFVTHDIDEAFLLGDRIAVLHEGSLRFLGTPVELMIAAQSDPYLASLMEGDRHCRILSGPVMLLAGMAHDLIFCMDSSEIPRTYERVRSRDIRGAVISSGDGSLQAVVGVPESADGIGITPVITLSPETTVQQALLQFSRTAARVAVVGGPPSGTILLLEDIVRVLSGGDLS